MLAAAVALKAGVSVWAFRTALRRRLLTPRAAEAAAAGWLAGFAALLSLGLLLAPGDFGVPPAVLPLGAAFFAPLARFALAPLAVDLARHR
jgi:hypothetical protein